MSRIVCKRTRTDVFRQRPWKMAFRPICRSCHTRITFKWCHHLHQPTLDDANVVVVQPPSYAQKQTWPVEATTRRRSIIWIWVRSSTIVISVLLEQPVLRLARLFTRCMLASGWTPLLSSSVKSVKRSRRRVIHRHTSKGHSLTITIYRNGDRNRHCYCKVTSLSLVCSLSPKKVVSLNSVSLLDFPIRNGEASNAVGCATSVRCQRTRSSPNWRRWNLSGILRVERRKLQRSQAIDPE